MKNQLKKEKPLLSYKQSLVLKKEPNCSLSLAQKVVSHLQKSKILKPKEPSWQDLVQGFFERNENIIDIYGRGRGRHLTERIGRGEFVVGKAVGGVGKRVQRWVLVELPGENVLAG